MGRPRRTSRLQTKIRKINPQFLKSGIRPLVFRMCTYFGNNIPNTHIPCDHKPLLSHCIHCIRCDVSRTVRVDEDTYRKLTEYAGKLQEALKRPISMNDAIKHLTDGPEPPRRISDLAGSWNATDEEIEAIKRSLSTGWNRWKPKRNA